VQLSVGQTAQESLARLLAGAVGGDLAAVERLQTAFGYDIVDAFDAVDGVTRIEEEIHLRGFASQPGEHYVERVKAGDAMEQVAAPQAPPPEHKDTKANQAKSGRHRIEFKRTRYDDVLDEFSRSTRPETFDPPPDPYRTIEVERAGARWYYPVDPVVMVQGLGRSLRHGFDGRFANEQLACRLSGDPVASVAGLLRGEHVLENRIDHGGVPAEAKQLLEEAVLQDPFAVDDVAAIAASVSGQQAGSVQRRLRGERALHLRAQQAGSDAPRLGAASLREGVEASPVAETVWRQPWIPLCLEWELELSLEDGVDPARWELGELDFELRAPVASPAQKPKVAGRSLLNATAARLYADQVNRFLEQEDRLDAAGQGGVVEEGSEGLLRATATQAEFADVMSAAFDGLREKLLGFDTNLAWEDAAGAALLAPSRAPSLLRAGSAKLTRARVVDAFGRRLDFGAADLARLMVGEALRPPQLAVADPGTLMLSPRITQASRLQLRLLDASDDGAEATLDQAAGGRSPIAGWLLPDHADAALEFYDAAGDPAGQLRHQAIGGGVAWESAPGTQAAFGEAPAASLTSPHLTRMATALMQRDAADRAGRLQRSDSPLEALLRVIDTTLWTVDPFGHAGNEHLSMLIGRPIAVVRAELRLEVDDDSERYGLPPATLAARKAAYEELSRKALDVRLGSLAHFGDGLLGYFVADDYHRFHPVHASVLQSALPSGPRTGFLGTQSERAEALTPVPIEQAYVEPDPTVTTRPGQTVRLTLLMDPGSAVHVTSGLLPRKSVSLERDWIAGPLQRISPSFRAGPLLLGPQSIQLPNAAVLAQEQVWSRRDTPLSWREDPILAATNEAALPEQSPVAQEGYIRARPESP
jgi:hypothetical protein